MTGCRRRGRRRRSSARSGCRTYCCKFVISSKLHVRACARCLGRGGLTYFEMEARVIDLYVTPLMVPVSPSMALIRIPARHVSRMITDHLLKWGFYISIFFSLKRGAGGDLRGLPFTEFLTSELLNVTVSTVLSSRPPTEPIDRPCPPEQTPFVNVMS